MRPLDPAHRDEAPGFESNDALFESMPVDAEEWIAFRAFPDFVEDVRALRPGGIIGTYEEAWFEAPQLPALIALLERGPANAPAGGACFSRRALWSSPRRPTRGGGRHHGW